MAYSEKIIKRALQLRENDSNLSAQKIADILCKEFPKDIDSNKFASRTVQNWINKEIYSPKQPLSTEAIYHDRKVFKKLDKIMDERQFYGFFYHLLSGHSEYSKTIQSLAKYEYYAQFESYKYINKYLKKLHEQFMGYITNLGEFTSPHTFSSDGNTEILKIHFPVPGDIHWQHLSDKERAILLPKFEKEFNTLTEKANKAYSVYRATIREILLV